MCFKLHAMTNVAVEEYASSLCDLTMNSKPLINMLTMLAEDNIVHAPDIVQAVEKHLQKVPSDIKLPVLYLIDSIVKNVGHAYIPLFTQNIVSTFCNVFEKVDEKTRAQMFKLRQTWNEVFPAKKLYAVDVRVNSIDPAWPITAQVPTSYIHVNPKFLSKVAPQSKAATGNPTPAVAAVPTVSSAASRPLQTSSRKPAVHVRQAPAASSSATAAATEAEMREQLLKKQKELLELQQRKLELELLQTKAKLEEQQKQLERQAGSIHTEQTQPLVSPIKDAVRLAVSNEAKQAVPVAAVVGAVNVKQSAKMQRNKPSVPPRQTRDPRLTRSRTTVAANTSSVGTTSDNGLQASTQHHVKDSRLARKDPRLEIRQPSPAAVNAQLDAVLPAEPVGVTQLPQRQRATRSSTSAPNGRDANRTVPRVGSPLMYPSSLLEKNSDLSGNRPSPKKKEREKGKDREREKEKEKERDREREKEKEKEREKQKEKEREREIEKEREMDKEKERQKEQEKEREKDEEREKERERDQERGKEREREREKEKERDRTRDREKYKDREKERDREKHKEKDKGQDEDSDKSLQLRLSSPRKFCHLPDISELDVIASPSPPSPLSPPTPPWISISPVPERMTTTFKDVKSRKGRSFRKRREGSPSLSPPDMQQSSGDVDLRGPPPDKVSRLSLSPKCVEPHVNVDTKDVDLRPLTRGSPSKKRQSSERMEQPPPKRSKAEMLDVLFGSEDVDLRTLAPVAVPTLPGSPPSPPPPPVSPPPSASAAAGGPQSPTTPSAPAAAAGKGYEHGVAGWAQLKEAHPDAYKSPATPLPSHNQHSADRHASQMNLFERPFDRLGRPLLYRKLQEEQRAINASGEDTDMRMLRMDSDLDFNINMIIAQAEEQLKSGNISFKEYNTLLKQVIHINEIQKLREAQRRDEQENKENWGTNNVPVTNMGTPMRRVHTASPLPGEDSNRDSRGSPPCAASGARFGDIDERFPGGNLPPPPSLAPATAPASAPAPPPTSGPTPATASGSAPAPTAVQVPPQAPLPPAAVQWGASQGAPPPRPPSWIDQPPWGPRLPPTSTAGPNLRHQPPPFRRPPDFPHPPPHYRWRQCGPGPGTGPGPRVPYDHQDEPHRFERFPANRFTRPPPPLPPHHQRMQQHQLFAQEAAASQGPVTELPPADPLLLDLITQDSMRTINIDGVPREIRYYGDTAIVFLAFDEPREISFQNGIRRVTFDDHESIHCGFNEPYRDFTLDGQKHRIRFGAPTRELYIDGKWYECFFGGPSINIDIGGKMRSVKLDGPPPNVKIGFVKRTDLVAGKINLIINARTMVPVFLDAKPQRFDIENKPHVLRFANALKTVLLNGKAFDVEFGGLPQSIVVRGKKHFVRFSLLPQGVRPGLVNIVNMETLHDQNMDCVDDRRVDRVKDRRVDDRLVDRGDDRRVDDRHISDRRMDNRHVEDHRLDERRLPSPETTSSISDAAEPTRQPLPVQPEGHSPVLPMLGGASRRKLEREQGRDSPESLGARNSPTGAIKKTGENNPSSFSIISTTKRPLPVSVGQMPLEMLTSLIPASMAPAAASGVGYCVEQQDSSAIPQQLAPQQQQAAASSTLSLLPGLGEVNVEELFRKLVATGIVPSSQGVAAGASEEKKSTDDPSTQIKPVDFSQPETLRVRQPALVALLYSGIQCSSCGVRFPPEHTMKYSQHLDWHFRQNRRERDSTRKAQSRKWYYDVSDWIQFEEIEDLEERAQSWFETQQAGGTGTTEDAVNEVPSVSAEGQEDAVCEVCHDRFEQFYNEEREEWHLRMAIRVDEHVYHPLCYEDLKAAETAAMEEVSSITDEGTIADNSSNMEEEVSKLKEEDSNNKADIKEEAIKEEALSSETVAVKSESKEDLKPGTETPEDKEMTEERDKETEKENELAKDMEKITVKQEPVENKEEQMGENLTVEIKTENGETEDINEDLEPHTPPPLLPSVVDTTLAAVSCSIDGNVQFEEAPSQPPALSTGRIKINIGKVPAPLPPVGESDEVSTEEPHSPPPTRSSVDDIALQSELVPAPVMTCETFQPPPPGVEPVSLKPRLVGLKMTELPPVSRGTELSGLCSIM